MTDERGITANKEWATRWLSEARLRPYLDACEGDIDLALELHEWNLGLGRALMGDIAHLELALRNAYDRALTDEGGQHWLFDPNSPVTSPIVRKSKSGKERDVNLVNRRAIADAMSRAHDPCDPNQIVAGLTLGFWAHMTDRSRERALWIPHLHKAWPVGTDRAALNLRLSAANKLRNRVAHNERLFNPGAKGCSPKSVDTDIIEMFTALCPDAAARLSNGTSPAIDGYLEQHPAPVEVEL